MVGTPEDPWFVAKDVCDALGMGEVGRSLRYLDDDEHKTLPAAQFVQVSGGSLLSRDGRSVAQGVPLINESGLYSLILRSRKKSARQPSN